MIPRLIHDHFHPKLISKSPYTGHLTIGPVYLNKLTGSLTHAKMIWGDVGVCVGVCVGCGLSLIRL
jgi:hypothetical protein